VAGRVEDYITESQQDDLPVSLIGLATDIIFEIGKRDGTKLAYREIQSTLERNGRKIRELEAENTRLNSQINELILNTPGEGMVQTEKYAGGLYEE
jgi:hypothetical protein